jgi:hypothetical protein
VKRAIVAVIAGAVIAPALATSAGSSASAPKLTITSQSAVVAYHGLSLRKEPSSRPATLAIPYGGARPSYQVGYLGYRAGEPTIGVDRHGTAYVVGGTVLATAGTIVTPFGSANTQQQSAVFLASTDAGRSWHVDEASLLAGQGGAGHPWFFDPYVYVDRPTSRVFEGTLTDVAGSYFDFSDDHGASWTRAEMYVPGINDHETVFAGAVPKGSGLSVSDTSFGRIVYYCVNQLVNASCARSVDGGRTFVPTGGIAVTPSTSGGPNGDPSDVRETQVDGVNTYCEGLTGHGTADGVGRIFLPWTCMGPWLSISTDAGSSWKQVRIDPASDIGSEPRTNNTSVAVDAADNLYYVWWDQRYKLPFLSISRDHGTTWSTPLMVAPPDVKETNMITVAAGARGRLALTFLGTTDADATHSNRPWNLYTVLTTDALGSAPTFLASITNPGGPDDPVHRGTCQGPCSGMLDYLDEPAVAPDLHGTVWAVAVDTCTSATGCSGKHGTSAEASDAQGYVVRQLTGPWLH